MKRTYLVFARAIVSSIIEADSPKAAAEQFEAWRKQSTERKLGGGAHVRILAGPKVELVPKRVRDKAAEEAKAAAGGKRKAAGRSAKAPGNSARGVRPGA